MPQAILWTLPTFTKLHKHKCRHISIYLSIRLEYDAANATICCDAHNKEYYVLILVWHAELEAKLSYANVVSVREVIHFDFIFHLSCSTSL